MHLEMQFDPQKLLGLLRNRFLQQGICFTDPIAVPISPGKTVTYYFDHLVISDQTHFHRVNLNDIVVYGADHVQGFKLQVVQPLSFFLATLADLQFADDQPAQYTQFDLDLIFDVFMSKDKDGWMLHVDFADLVSGIGVSIPDSVKQVVQQNLGGQTKPTPVDLSSLKALTGEDFVVVESFVGCDSGITRIVIRFERDTLDLEGSAAWEQFLTGNIDNNLLFEWTTEIPGDVDLGPNGKPIKIKGPTQPKSLQNSVGGEWSLFLDFGILRPAFQNAIYGAATSDFTVDPNTVQVSWVLGTFVEAGFHGRFTHRPGGLTSAWMSRCLWGLASTPRATSPSLAA